MLHIEIPKRKNTVAGYLLSVITLLTVLFLFVYGVKTMAGKTEADRLSALTNAIRRASIQCYAIENRYPPSVEYLEEHYGIVIDHERYNVFYDGWASNIMPDITVLPAESQESKEGWN